MFFMLPIFVMIGLLVLMLSFIPYAFEYPGEGGGAVVFGCLFCLILLGVWLYKGSSCDRLEESRQIFQVRESDGIQFIVDDGAFVNLNYTFSKKLLPCEQIEKTSYKDGPYYGLYFIGTKEYKIVPAKAEAK